MRHPAVNGSAVQGSVELEGGPDAQDGTKRGTVRGMATNLRLRSDAEEAVRAEAKRTGRSQQDVIRDAIDRYLVLRPEAAGSDLDLLVASGAVRPPRLPYRKPRRRLIMPAGVTTAELLDRSDRV